MSEPLNLVFIFADQMHGFALGCMGNGEVLTPHLDRLASQGVLFQAAYSCAPVCTPFRAQLFSGRYPSQTGARSNDSRIPPGEVALADRLNAGGVCTSYVGKWHLGGTGNVAVPPELRGGFQRFKGYQCYNDFLTDIAFYDHEGREDRREGHRTEATFDVALEELDELAGKHFALFISEQAPHYPCQPSPEFLSLYEGRPVSLRPNYRPVDPYTPTWSPKSPPPETDPVNLAYAGRMENYLRLYYAMITQVDAQVGRLLKKLEALGIADRTAVIFTSDHGDMQGSHGLINKDWFYEESVRIPLIARIPGGASGRVFRTPLGSVDFYPTLLEAAGCPPEPRAEGVSFWGSMKEGAEPEAMDVFAEDVYNHWFMIRRGDWKLAVEEGTFRPTHLFNLREDPHELSNRVKEEALSGLVSSLAGAIRQWYERIALK